MKWFTHARHSHIPLIIRSSIAVLFIVLDDVTVAANHKRRVVIGCVGGAGQSKHLLVLDQCANEQSYVRGHDAVFHVLTSRVQHCNQHTQQPFRHIQ